MWSGYRWTGVLVAFVNLALGSMFPWSPIINHVDLSETFDVVSSQLLENRGHVLMISYISNSEHRSSTW